MTALITLFLYMTPMETVEACRARGIADAAAGCAVVNGRYCEVHITKPQLGYVGDFEVAGHEFYHCFFRGFH